MILAGDGSDTTVLTGKQRMAVEFGGLIGPPHLAVELGGLIA